VTSTLKPAEWNGWQLTSDALVYAPYDYGIDFDRMLTTEQIVFWVVQISQKRWPGALDGFVTAVDEILNPQTTMRNSQGFTPDSIRRQVAASTAVPR
jgi:hypothetical protein